MNHSDALYKRIYQKLLTEIEEGMYKDGQRLPPRSTMSVVLLRRRRCGL